VHVNGVLESCVYASDLESAESFYVDVLGLRVHVRETGRHVFFRCGDGMVLVFDPARTSTQPGESLGTPIPAHGARGAGHIAFRVDDDALDAWRGHLAHRQVDIEAEVRWPNGAQSIYVRDPAGNSVELATRKLWGLDPESKSVAAKSAADHDAGSKTHSTAESTKAST
jgi:catechol 2,3-dioxygenase-like lactoylglutathione lyase family enzyme